MTDATQILNHVGGPVHPALVPIQKSPKWSSGQPQSLPLTHSWIFLHERTEQNEKCLEFRNLHTHFRLSQTPGLYTEENQQDSPLKQFSSYIQDESHSNIYSFYLSQLFQLHLELFGNDLWRSRLKMPSSAPSISWAMGFGGTYNIGSGIKVTRTQSFRVHFLSAYHKTGTLLIQVFYRFTPINCFHHLI